MDGGASEFGSLSGESGTGLMQACTVIFAQPMCPVVGGARIVPIL